MKIISIDPGVTTGVVVAFFLPRVDAVKVELLVQEAITQPEEVVQLAITNRCRQVVMEQKPRNPNPEGLDSWQNIYQRLMNEGFLVSHNIHMDQHVKRTVFFVQPSEWKPFMRFRKDVVPEKRHHIADAARMLHYFLQFNYPTKEIYYG